MVREAVRLYGRVDVLINNAGRAYDARVEDIRTDYFRELIELNLVAPLVAMEEVIPVMRKRGRGMIVNVSSGTSLMNLPGMGAYSSLKKALNGISQTAREELKGETIAVCVVYPYMTKTDFDKNAIGAAGDMEEVLTRDGNLPPWDTAGYAAEKILEGIEKEETEVYAHEWMRDLGKRV